jgi:hypothetical protein
MHTDAARPGEALETTLAKLTHNVGVERLPKAVRSNDRLARTAGGKHAALSDPLRPQRVHAGRAKRSAR